MKGAPAVQFRGIDKVLAAYKNQEIPNWAIFQGSQFLFSDDKKKLSIEEGESTLRATLQMIEGSTDVYTIRVYKSVESGITNATKYNGSFNFLLTESQSRGDEYASYRTSTNERLAGIEGILRRLIPQEGEEMDEPEPAKQPEGIGAVVNKLMENPQIQEYMAAKLIGLVEKIIPSAVQQSVGTIYPAAARVAGDIAGEANTSASQTEKINSAIDTLLEVDPLLGDHLLKLATIAQKSPGQYQSLISMLNTFS